MYYEKVLNIWAEELLLERGYKVNKNSSFNVNLEIAYSGGCETCSYEEAVIKIENGVTYCEISSYGFREILLKLIEITEREKDKI